MAEEKEPQPIKEAVRSLAVLQHHQESTTTSKTDDEERLQNNREALRLGKSEKASREMGIPKRYVGKILSDLKRHQAEAMRALDAVMADKTLLITGSVGTGKTHMAVGCMYEYAARHMVIQERGWRSVVTIERLPQFVPLMEVLLRLKDGFGRNESELSLLEPYVSVPFLVLDDFGAETDTGWTRGIAYRLLDMRHRECLPTVITSNLKLSEIAKIDDRIASRLAEEEVINLVGEDWRSFR